MSSAPLLTAALTCALLAPAAAADTPAGLPAGTRVLPDLVYARPGGIELRLDACIPPSPTPLPVVVWIHGGGWRAGDRRDNHPPLALLKAVPGLAVASIDYRLSHQARFPAQIQDCVAAVRWIRANAAANNLDPARIAVWGASAGAHLAMLLGASGGKEWDEAGGERVQAVVSWFGPADLTEAAQARAGFEGHARADSGVAQLLGGTVAEKLELARRASPITHVAKGCPPFLLMYGDRDPIVPVDHGWRMQQALAAAGAKADLEVFGGNEHGGADFERVSTMRRIGEFVLTHAR